MKNYPILKTRSTVKSGNTDHTELLSHIHLELEEVIRKSYYGFKSSEKTADSARKSSKDYPIL